MRRIASIYLGGPDAAYPEAGAREARRLAMVEAAGFVGITGEGFLVETEPSEVMAREIYAARIARLRLADAGIMNFTPWRSPSCDPAAAFEAGFLAALGKPVFGYINVPSEDEADYRDRVEAFSYAAPDAEGVWRDAEGCVVEDFGLPEPLMIWAEARRLYVVVTPNVLQDLTGLRLCLDAVRAYTD